MESGTKGEGKVEEVIRGRRRASEASEAPPSFGEREKVREREEGRGRGLKGQR